MMWAENTSPVNCSGAEPEVEIEHRHELAILLQEADELVAILTASAKTAKARKSWSRTGGSLPDRTGHSRSDSD